MKIQNPYEALLKISQDINSMKDTAVLLDKVMDIAMGTLAAERGFIILKSHSSDHQFDLVTARNISQETISSIRELSSSVVNKVIKEGKSILTLDAQTDDRFSGAQSIIMQKIRSVICAPLKKDDQLIGAIYMDTRSGSDQFDEDSLKFLEAFTIQAAIAIENSRIMEKLESENKQLKKQVALSQLFPEIIGKSPSISRILEMIRDVADSNATILIEGESGTGKELVARALHFNSKRKEKTFIPIFCGSLAENLLESELFGHRKGSFTGAFENKAGLFEEAHGGTLFLDEIGDISKTIQTKLLRVIQEGEVKRVGESAIRKVDVRILSATNKNLQEEVEAGNFREDLFYRLNVINFKMPPLRERREDIPLLVNHFLSVFTEKNKKHVSGFSKEAYNFLMEYSWPGNIRELENTIERAVILTREKEITPELLQLKRSKPEMVIGRPLKEVEKYVVLQTLEQSNNNRTKAAEVLGVSRRWLQYQLKNWGITDED
ncbi:MAG: sigma-54-dependent Fis family transcriptional regulator [bacterium]|nr:MAG: sigma-54-dependent Fis family transcriptional regulator [bacterium]